MANPAPTINQINAFNATQGTTIDFNIIGGTELVRSNKIYIYDLSDNSLICTHLYVSTESIHELPPNTDGSIVYESGKSSADFVNGAQYYAQIQTFTDIAGTQGGSGLSVSKLFWCLVDPSLTIDTIPSSISTTSYNVSATYDANTSVVSNIIQQYQFNLYSATGSLLQSSGVVVGNGEQQGTSTAYDISYNFSGLSVGSSYYVGVDVTTTQGMSISAQSSTFTVSIDTPTLGEATVVNNACDGYISVTSNLSSEYGGSASGEIATFETDSVNNVTKLEVELEPIQDLHGYDKPWPAGGGVNQWNEETADGYIDSGTGNMVSSANHICSKNFIPCLPNTNYYLVCPNASMSFDFYDTNKTFISTTYIGKNTIFTTPSNCYYMKFWNSKANYGSQTYNHDISINYPSSNTGYFPYSNICPIVGHSEVETKIVGKNLFNPNIESKTASGVTYSYSNGGILLNGTKSGESKANLTSVVMDFPAGTYTFSGSLASGTIKKDNANYDNITAYLIDEGGNATSLGQLFESKTITLSESIRAYLRLTTWSDNVVFTNALLHLQIELGSTATDYAPYVEPIEVGQDFNVTLTSTVVDETPYLFKKTGDVRGDRESLELVGGTVNWNQLAGGTMRPSQTKNNVEYTPNNDGTFTLNGTADATDWWGATPYPSKSVVGHKYLIREANGNGSNTTFGLCFGSSTIIAYGTKETIANCTNASYTLGYAYVSGTVISNATLKPQITDLTAFFGNSATADYVYSLEQANAGAGIAWLRKYFPDLFTYSPYNAGELVSVNPTAHVTRGVNQWDEEWEVGYYQDGTGAKVGGSPYIRSKNKIQVVPNTSYYIYIGADKPFVIYQFDASENYIGSISYNIKNATFTTGANAKYIVFNSANASYGDTYKNDICINISDPSINGQYFPYEEHNYPITELELRGIPKLVDGELRFDGDTLEPKKKTIKYAEIDLGSLNYVYESNGDAATGNRPYFYSNAISDRKNGANLMCNAYTVASGGRDTLTDKGISAFNTSNNTAICIMDSAYTNASTLKTALSGKKLQYELANPIVTTGDYFTDPQEVSIYGTEEFVSSNGVPVGNKTTYKTRDIFGGKIDLASGVLTVTHKTTTISSFDGTFGVAPYGYAVYKSLSDRTKSRDTISNMFVSSTFGYDNMPLGSYQGNRGAVTTWTFILPSTITSLAEANTWLSNLSEPLVVTETLATPLAYQLTPHEIETLVGTNNVWSNAGDVLIEFNIPITNLLVKRQDVDDVSGNWLTLYSQPVEQASDMDFTFIDFLNQYGKTYKYALVPLLTQTQSGVEVEVEGGYTVSDKVQSIFDGVYIGDSTGVQRLKAGVAYNNLNTNQQVGVIPTLGNKYPIIVSNSNIQYDTGSVSGLIVPDDFYSNGNLSRLDMSDKREAINDFLTNKKPKILKDWNGNIWLVVFTDNVDISFDNNYGMGVATFTSGWTEVGDPTNQEDLQRTGLINVGGD